METVTISRETYDHLAQQARELEEIKYDDGVLKIHVDARGRTTVTTCSKKDAEILAGETIAGRVDFWRAKYDGECLRADVAKEDLASAFLEAKCLKLKLAVASGIACASILCVACLVAHITQQGAWL